MANFQDDDWNVRFNTGLPSFKLLKTVFKFVSLGRFKRANSAHALFKFQEFVTTLIKLMLNPPLQDLAYRFGIFLFTMSHIMSRWVTIRGGWSCYWIVIKRTFLMTSERIVLFVRKLWSADSAGWTGLKRPCIEWLAQRCACNNVTNLLWVTIMDIHLRPLILWPDHPQLRCTMPECFRILFGDKVAVIIDCFEVFIECPSNPLVRACTWSSYKHHKL